MSDMIERVARALRGFEAAWLLETGCVNPMGKAYEHGKARAAIAALREPSEAMMQAGCPDPVWHDNEKDFRRHWQAAIDAVLKEG